jgi:hypothetical protein
MRVKNTPPMNSDWLFCRIYGGFILIATVGVDLLGAIRHGTNLIAATTMYALIYVVFFTIHTWGHRANRVFPGPRRHLLTLFVAYHCLVVIAAVLLPNEPIYLALLILMYLVSIVLSVKYFESTMTIKPITERD